MMFSELTERSGSRTRRRGSRRVAGQAGVAAFVERLEARTLLSVTVESIIRQTSISLLDGPISEPAALVGINSSNGVKTFETTTLFGYGITYAQTPVRPAGTMPMGGVGLEIRFTADTQSVITVDWQTGDSISNPRTVGLTLEPGVTVLTLPHVYAALTPSLNNPPPFLETYGVTISEGTASAPLGLIAQVNVNVTYAMTHGPDLIIRGRDSDLTPDLVLFEAGADGSMVVSTNFESTNAIPFTRHTVAPGGAVYVDALGGNDRLLASAGFSPRLFLDGGAGDDQIVGGAGADSLRGGPGNDSIDGGDGNDLISGSAGHDWLFGGGGLDSLYGGSGNDRLDGGEGDDQLFGDAGDDQLLGGNGNDFLLGGLGADLLYGEAGNDALAGGYDNTSTKLNVAAILKGSRGPRGPQAVARILKANVPAPPAIPNRSFGPAIANDGVRDRLEGGTGRNTLAPHVRRGSPGNDQIVGRRRGDITIRLDDPPVPTLDVQRVVGYDSSSGADLIASPTRTSYVLNRTFFDGNSIYPLLQFPLISASQFQGFYGAPHPGQLMILELDNPAFNNAKPSFWEQYNLPYLQFGTSFGGVYLASSEPFDPKSRFNERTGIPSPLGMEVAFLLANHYAYDPMSRSFTVLA